MSSRSNLTYAARAELHTHPLAQRLLQIAEEKKSNLVFSADYTDSKTLLKVADGIIVYLGPIITVLKTHVDMVRDFDQSTVDSLITLSRTHNFLIFEDRKLVDIGSTVQKQYHEGTLRISEFAHIVNFSILGGEGIADALNRVVTAPNFPHPGERAFILLAEMTSKGSFATGGYTAKCVELARKHPESMMGWVATRSLADVSPEQASDAEDFLVFTTGVNLTSKGDNLGQQYQTPATAIAGGSDFLIAGRGIYASDNPLNAAEEYRKEGWEAYLRRLGKMT